MFTSDNSNDDNDTVLLPNTMHGVSIVSPSKVMPRLKPNYLLHVLNIFVLVFDLQLNKFQEFWEENIDVDLSQRATKVGLFFNGGSDFEDFGHRLKRFLC